MFPLLESQRCQPDTPPTSFFRRMCHSKNTGFGDRKIRVWISLPGSVDLGMSSHFPLPLFGKCVYSYSCFQDSLLPIEFDASVLGWFFCDFFPVRLPRAAMLIEREASRPSFLPSQPQTPGWILAQSGWKEVCLSPGFYYICCWRKISSYFWHFLDKCRESSEGGGKPRFT